jgi:hypothetical protein
MTAHDTTRDNLRRRVTNDLTLHPVTSRKDEIRLDNLRGLAIQFALAIVEDCPLGREQSSALTKVEESLYHAVAAIVRRQVEDVASPLLS